MKEIILALLILLFIIACGKEQVQVKPWSFNKHIDSSYLDTFYNDTL